MSETQTQTKQVRSRDARAPRGQRPRAKKEYQKVKLLPGQRIIDGVSITTSDVTAIIDITGDPTGENETKPTNCMDDKKTKRKVLAAAFVFALASIPFIFINMLVFGVLLAIGVGIVGILGCFSIPDHDNSTTYLEGRYDHQLSFLNKKAVYVQNPDATIIKYVVRTGVRKQGSVTGTGCVIL